MEYEQGMEALPYIQRGEKADLLDKINPEAIVERIKHELQGEQFKDGVWVIIPELKERSLTRQGATEITNLMLSVSSQNVSISKLKADEIAKRTRNIARTAQKMCLDNWKDYGIKKNDQLCFVNEIIISNTFITLKQPEGEGIRKLLMGVIQEQNLNQSSANKNGFFSKIFGGNKNNE